MCGRPDRHAEPRAPASPPPPPQIGAPPGPRRRAKRRRPVPQRKGPAQGGPTAALSPGGDSCFKNRLRHGGWLGGRYFRHRGHPPYLRAANEPLIPTSIESQIQFPTNILQFAGGTTGPPEQLSPLPNEAIIEVIMFPAVLQPSLPCTTPPEFPNYTLHNSTLLSL